jgi:phosphoribosyl-ATP pyrophosphohydrolase
LGQASTRENVVWEAADMLYFTLARLAAEGIDLAEVEAHLDRRALKITRRG